MLNKDAETLLNKYRNGTVTEEEIDQLLIWVQQLETDKKVDLSVKDLEAVRDELWPHLALLIEAPKRILIWPRIAVAASLLLFLSTAGYLLVSRTNFGGYPTAKNIANDVAPGTNGATLTLGNGKQIILNGKPNGRLALQGNIMVTKTANGQLLYQSAGGRAGYIAENTLATKRKQQYKVVLSDGTGVWLNAASSITYPTVFNGKERLVAITGEAYFEVAHNAKMPFRVKSQNQTVEVLGTHFNINAYPDELAVKTTLLEGSVKVSVNNVFKFIKPGQQATLKNNQLYVNDASTEEAVAWKNGYFRFNQEKIEPIMRKLSRWYDIDVMFNGPVPDDEFSGTISRFKNISEVLKALEYYKTVHFKVQGRRVTVSK